MLASTLCTIHNERFIIRLVDQIRDSITAGEFDDLREHVLGRYYGSKNASKNASRTPKREYAGGKVRVTHAISSVSILRRAT